MNLSTKNGIFGSLSIIEHPFRWENAYGYLVGFDLDDSGVTSYRWTPLIGCLMAGLHEFAYGFHEGTTTDNTETFKKLIDAARSIYKVPHFHKVRDIYQNGQHIEDDLENRFLRRGEFGELVLHVLLREYFGTIPLMSKIYFKDSFSSTVHGFDCVHVNPVDKTLWIGESKLYIEPRSGLKELIKDLQTHFTIDYINSEFSIISKKIKHFENIPLLTEWQHILADTTKLKDKFKQINIPLLCTYSCDLFERYDDENSVEFLKEFRNKLKSLKAYFDDNFSHPFASNLNIVILLFPVPSKIELVKRLHRKLSLMQALGD